MQNLVMFNQDEASGNGVSGDSSKYNPATVEDALKIITALEKRVNEHKSEAQQARSTAKDFETRIRAMEENTRKQLEADGNHKTLAEQYARELQSVKPLAERANTLEAIIRQSNDQRIARIPEQSRDLIPFDYPPEKLQEWLNKSEALLVRQPAPSFDARAGATSGVSVTLSAEEIAIGRQLGLTQEQILDAKRKDLENKMKRG